jgi:hypothetical protein
MRPLYKKLLIISLIIIALGVIAYPHVSEAFCIMPSCFAVSLISTLLMGIINTIQFLLAQLAWLFSYLIEWMMDWGSTIMTLPVVQSGFKVSLSLVNMMLVIGLMISAFQIILGVDDHHAKERIKNVILAAILINFSLLFAGFLLDASNVFTNFFLKDVDGLGIADAFSLSKLSNMIAPSGNITTLAGLFSLIPLALFSLAITALALVIQIAVFITALIRNIWVAILLTVMPLAWGCWTFPGLEKYHHQWWENFIKQGLIVLPTISFFLYLTVATAGAMGGASSLPPDSSILGFGSFSTVLNTFLQMFILGAFLIGGLKISQAAGAAGASAGMTMALAVGGAAYKARFRVGGKDYGLQKGVQMATGAGANLLNRLQSVPYLGGFMSAIGTNKLANTMSGAAHADHEIEEFQKDNFKNMNYIQVRNFVPRNAIEAAAKFKQLAEMNKLDKYTTDFNAASPTDQAKWQSAVQLINQYGDETHKRHDGHASKDMKDLKEVKEYVALNPHLAPEIYGAEPKTITDASGATRLETADEARTRVIQEETDKASYSEIGKRDPDIYDTTKGTAAQQADAIIVLTQTVSSPVSIRAVVNHSSEQATKLEQHIKNRMGQINSSVATLVQNQTDIIRQKDREARIARRNGDDAGERAAKADRKLAFDARRSAITSSLTGTDREQMELLAAALDIKDQAVTKDTTI